MLHGYDIKITDDDLNDSDKEEQKIDWTDEAFLFVRDFIYGIEDTVYKKASLKNEIKKLQTSDGILMGSSILEFYLSQVYNQLVEKTNALIVTKFVTIGNICDEKPLYMLVLVSKVIKIIYPKMPRSGLDIENEEKYKKSVLLVLTTMKNFITNELKDSLKELKEAKKMKKNEINDMENKMKESNKSNK